jgi:hypothetical protein
MAAIAMAEASGMARDKKTMSSAQLALDCSHKYHDFSVQTQTASEQPAVRRNG